MKRLVLNSAVVTTPGTYEYRLISPAQAKRWLEQGSFVSYVAYQETCDALTALSGVHIPRQRKTSKMETGDEALVFRLTCRLDDPDLKGKLTAAFVLANCEIGLLTKKGD